MPIYNIIAGLALLLFGRKLFWLFVAIAGFLFAQEIVPVLFADLSQWQQLAIALVLGCLGALLAVFMQRLAFAFGGFFAGIYLAARIIQPFIGANDHTLLLVMFGMGSIGAIIAVLLTDQVITLLSCVIGAGAIVGALQLGREPAIVLFVILTGAGFLFQEKLLPAKKQD